MISYNDLIDSGLPISNDIPEAEVEFAVKVVTDYVIKPQLTEEFYAELLADPSLRESVLAAGLEDAYLHFTFSYIVYHSFRVTRFGMVSKLSDESSKVPLEDINYIAKRHLEIGQHYLSTIKSLYNIQSDNKNTFSALLW